MEYDIMFFEALGEENAHLHEEIKKAQQRGTIPADLRYEITTEVLQDYMAEHPDVKLPDIISTKTHSDYPETWMKNGCKKSVISRSAGYDHIEALADVINATSLRRYCVNAVAETAAKLVYMVCGNVNQYQANMASFERNNCISFKEMTGLKATVFGVGKIGKRIYELLVGAGMDVYGVDIRAEELSKEYGDSVRFISKEEALDSDVFVCGMNYTKNPASRFYNKNYFTEDYLSRAKKGLVFVNVTRGEINDEIALLKLYKSGHLFGIGLDAFALEEGITKVLRGARKVETEQEAAQKELIDISLARTGNVYTQPHQGFNSDVAALDKAKETIKHLEAYYRNGKEHFDSQLPYYN